MQTMDRTEKRAIRPGVLIWTGVVLFLATGVVRGEGPRTRNAALVRSPCSLRTVARADQAGIAAWPGGTFPMLAALPGNTGELLPPSWWTFRHTATLVGGMTLVIVLGLGWVVLLRRQVAEQTRRLQERLKRELALERHYQELFENANDLIFTQDMEGRLTSLNPAARRALGYSEEEARHLTLDDILAPEFRERARHWRETKLAAGQMLTCECDFLSKDGRRINVEVSAQLLQREGRPTEIQAIGRDITERRRAEAALAETSSLFEALLENSPDLIYFKDRESRFVRYSRAFVQRFNLSHPDALKGKTDFDLFTPEHAQPAFEDEQTIIRTGQPIVGKLERETHTDGRVTWALTTKMPWRDAQGNIVGTFGISKDITAIKEAEARLAEEQQLFRLLLDNIPDVIYFKDRQSRFVRVSRSTAAKALAHAAKVDGFELPADPAAAASPETADRFAAFLVGKSDFDLFTPEHAQPAFEDEQTIIRTGQPIIGKLERETHPDGRVTWALTTKMPWRDTQGNIVGTFGISKDITAIKQAEAELDAAHKRLLEASRLAGMAEVATDVLHNVGNVLNSVNVSCALVLERMQTGNYANLLKIPAMLREHAGRLDEFLTVDSRGRLIPEYLTTFAESMRDRDQFVVGELQQLREHIEHIKQIVAMQQSYARVAGVEEQVDLRQLVEDALQINAAALGRHLVEVRREFEPVPPVLTDKHRVLQVLVNLIRNAKYALSDATRPDKLLTVRVGRNGNGLVHVQVVDNGVGIAPENLTRIFAHGFTTRRNGHGFGLHSSALAAKELGGTLSAHSDGPGQGAVFTLSLPLQRPGTSAS